MSLIARTLQAPPPRFARNRSQPGPCQSAPGGFKMARGRAGPALALDDASCTL